MRIFDGVYSWDGWGGKMKLGSGQCRMQVFDLAGRDPGAVAPLKRHIVVVSDLPEIRDTTRRDIMSVKSCASHIATHVVRDFKIDRNRMIWVEHYPGDPDGGPLRYPAAELFEEVEFVWKQDLALHPKWKALSPAMESLVRELLFAPEAEKA